MVKRAEPAPGEYSRAVVAELQAMMTKAGMSLNRLAALSGRSANYISIRMRNIASFTLTDIEEIGKVLDFNAAIFLGSVKVPNLAPVSVMHNGIDLMTVDLSKLKFAASMMEDSSHLETGYVPDES
jgi:hypothetical protein